MMGVTTIIMGTPKQQRQHPVMGQEITIDQTKSERQSKPIITLEFSNHMV